jgi:hypothetical protein
MYEFTVLQFWASVMAIDRAEDTMCSANYFKNHHLNTHGLTIVSSEIETPQPPDLTYAYIYIYINIHMNIYIFFLNIHII